MLSKRLLSTVMSVLVVGSLVAGCSAQTTTTTANNAATKAETKAATKAETKAEVKASNSVSSSTSNAAKTESKASNAKEETKASSNAAVGAKTESKSSNAKETASNTSKATEGAAAATQNKTDLKFGLSTDEGGKGDKSFNDAGIAGLEKIEKEFGIKPTIVESREASQYTQNLESLAKTNDLTVAVGFKMAEDITKVAESMPEKSFLLIDGNSTAPNVKNVLFKEQEGAYLMGVIAGSMTKSNKVGFVGGVEGDVIGKFEYGFAAGVYSVNKEAGKALLDRSMVRYAGNFSDSAKGTELAKDLYTNGADIIFHAAGGVGIGVFNAAKEMNKFAIGVDSDQAALIPDKADVILASMLKKVDVAVYNAAKEMIEGKFKPGTTVLGLKEEAVGLAPTIHPALKENKAALDKVEEATKKIMSGEVVVPGTLEELKKFAQ